MYRFDYFGGQAMRIAFLHPELKCIRHWNTNEEDRLDDNFFFISNVESSAFSFPMLCPGFILLVIKNIPVWAVEL